MKDSFENSIKQSLDGFETPYNADAWAKMSEKLDAKMPSGNSSGSEAAAYGAAAGATVAGVEEAIKQGLDGFEMPYSPDAWQAMESKLDAKKPVTPPTSNTKWYIAASAIIVAATASYFMFTGDSDQSNGNDPVIAQNETIADLGDSNSTGSDNNEQTTTVNNDDNVISNSNENELTLPDPFAEPTAVNGVEPANSTNPLSQNVGSSQNTSTSSNEGNENEQNGNTQDPNRGDNVPFIASTPMIIPVVEDVCEGEAITVRNENSEPLLVLGPDLYFIVPAKETRTIRTKEGGIHTIGALDSEADVDRNEFNVHHAPIADFLIDASTKFELGLPTTKVESTVPGNEFNWIFSGQKVNGTEANAHFYKKGEHNITLTVTGSNGCESSITKHVYVEDNYNLMAVNSFRPNSTNPKTNTFMPFALTERDAQFTMIIIDPRDGHVIYETSDASQGWNGTDQRSGRPVAFESAYIWKVTLQKRAINEASNEYSGHVIPVHSNN